MASLVWDSINDKLEAIGYLAVPGVISAIEATVPRGKTEQFQEEYAGKYSPEYPYEADKYGRQFRIYLNDTEGCPDALREHLDGAYGNRINNTEFIDELVKEYGFKFTKYPQDSEFIRSTVLKKYKRPLFEYFDKGYKCYGEFVQNIIEKVKRNSDLPSPDIQQYEEKSISRRSDNKRNGNREYQSGFTANQMLKLGWVGEEYIAYLLKHRDPLLLQELGLDTADNYEVEWFNEGVQNAMEEYVIPDIKNQPTHYDVVKKWEDKSVGKGCDIVVHLSNRAQIYIEVKTSKRSYPFFNMTSVEMQEMEKREDEYFLIKVNYIERLLNNESPDIVAIRNPYEKLFHPKQIKEATFIIGGR